MDFQKLKKSFIIALIIGFIAFVTLSIYSDFHQLMNAFRSFNYRYLPAIFLLAPLNYFFRYIKWSYYLKLINVNVPRQDNILIFLSGLSMTITPGKVGEFLKSYLLKEKYNIPMSSTAPLVIGERLTDGMSVLILAGIGSMAYHHGGKILFLVLLGMIGFVSIVQSPRLVYLILDRLGKIKVLKRFDEELKNFYDHSYMILKIKPLTFAVVIGVVSWFFEGVVVYLTVKALGYDLALLACVFIVSFSFIIGALSMMPGGLFAVEGSVVGLLVMMGLDKSVAVATTMITRFSTLWLGVIIGLFGLMAVYKNKVD